MKETIKLMLDYLQGPIWISDADTGEPLTGIDVIDSDEIIIKLNGQIADLYLSYYEFDSYDMPCWFNEDQQKADKDKMLSLINQLKFRLQEINDGSFEIEDLITPFYDKL